MEECPLYLFTGFLCAGKTKFIQETLGDARFHKGEKTLLLICEEGEEEYDPAAFAAPGVVMESLQEESQLTPALWETLWERHQPERILVEYHGMWQLASLYESLPETIPVVQEFCFFETDTALVYNANLRNLVVDKLQNCDLVAFNRMATDADVMPYHKLVRAVSRNAVIVYEREDGTVQQDEIEDPLPFDINAPVIEIGDADYAIWYRDMTEEMKKYQGKTVSFLAMVARSKEVTLSKDQFVIGRNVMTCCIEDIRYAGLVCAYAGADAFEAGAWVRVKATLAIKHHSLYGRKGPVLTALEVTRTTAPSDPIVTF